MRTTLTNTGNQYTYGPYGYVTSAGQMCAGEENILIFEAEALTREQWEKLEDIHWEDRETYVGAILHGDADEIARIEEENGI